LIEYLTEFQEVFGDKLVRQFMFDSDFMDDPCLPSPNQLKYKILIKNKKLQSYHSGISLKQRVNFFICVVYTIIHISN